MAYSDTPEFWRQFVRYLGSVAARTAQVIQIGPAGGAVLDSVAAGGDLQTAADEAAGDMVRELLTKSAVPVALLDEATGELQPLHDNPVIGLIVDELDGTRPARMGMPTCCVSIAAYPLEQEARLCNVRCGVIMRLDTQVDYMFVRGHGVWRRGFVLEPPPDATVFEDACVWIEEAMAHTGLHGLYTQDFMPHTRHGAARIGSICYGGMLMVDGGVQILTHIPFREYQTWPEVRQSIHKVFGSTISIYAYDIAALVPMLWECGFIATDAWGELLEDLVIDKSGTGFEVPGLIAASNADLHKTTLDRVKAREQYLIERRDDVLRLLEL